MWDKSCHSPGSVCLYFTPKVAPSLCICGGGAQHWVSPGWGGLELCNTPPVWVQGKDGSMGNPPKILLGCMSCSRWRTEGWWSLQPSHPLCYPPHPEQPSPSCRAVAEQE